jgi:diguanylate cyclase (GGDEF)-like protein
VSDQGEESRLRALQATHLLDSPPERAFDRLTRLAGGLLGAPVALVSLVDERRQFFKSALGLKEPWASRRETPLTHSFCKVSVHERAPLIVNDARVHPTLRDNLAIRDLDVIAYAGIPLVVDGEAVGAFCVIDDKPREWTAGDVQLLTDLAESVVSEIELRMALRAAGAQRALNDALIESLGDAVLAMDTGRRFLIANEAARRVFEGAKAGAPLPDDWARLHESKRIDGTPLASEDGALVRALRGLRTDGLTHTLQGPSATEAVWVEASGRPVLDASGEVIAGVAVYRDVTKERDNTAALLRSEQVHRAIVQHLPNGGVFMVDRDLRYVAADGPMVGDVLRHAKTTSLIGESVFEIASDQNRDEILAIYRGALAGERQRYEVQRGDRFYEVSAVPILDEDEQVSHALAFLYDVTERKRLAERDLTVDVLTGITNRRGAETALRVEDERRRRGGTALSVAIFDIDHFKRVNDVHGHATGDAVLRHVAKALIAQARVTDLVARWGGEEFLAVLPGSLDGAVAFAERARQAIAGLACPPVEHVTISVGLAELAPAETPTEAIARADAHLYEAKRSGRNRVVT